MNSNNNNMSSSKNNNDMNDEEELFLRPAASSLREPLLLNHHNSDDENANNANAGEDDNQDAAVASPFWIHCDNNNNINDGKQQRRQQQNQQHRWSAASDASLGLEDVLKSWYETNHYHNNNNNNSNSNPSPDNENNPNSLSDDIDNDDDDYYYSDHNHHSRLPRRAWYKHPLQVMAMISNFSTSFNVVNISLVLPILKSILTTTTAASSSGTLDTFLVLNQQHNQHHNQHAQDESMVASALLAGMIGGQVLGGALGDVPCLGLAGALCVVMVLQTVASLASAAVPLPLDTNNITNTSATFYNNEYYDHHDENWGDNFDYPSLSPSSSSSSLHDFYFQLALWRFILGIGAGAVYPLAACLAVEQQGGHYHDDDNNNANSRRRQAADHQALRLKRVVWTFAMQGVGFCAVPALACILVHGPSLIFSNGGGDGGGDHSSKYQIPLTYVWRIILGAGCIPGIIMLYLQYQWLYGHKIANAPTATANANNQAIMPLMMQGEPRLQPQGGEALVEEGDCDCVEDAAKVDETKPSVAKGGAAVWTKVQDKDDKLKVGTCNTTREFSPQSTLGNTSKDEIDDEFNISQVSQPSSDFDDWAIGKGPPPPPIPQPDYLGRSVSCPGFSAANPDVAAAAAAAGSTSNKSVNTSTNSNVTPSRILDQQQHALPLSPRSTNDVYRLREQENTGMTNRELHDDSDGEVGTFLDSSPDLDMSSTGVFRDSEPPVINTGWWISLQTEEGLFRKLMGTAVTWFLFDVLFYGNTLFQPVVIEQAFGSRQDMEPDALIRRVVTDSLVLNLVSLPGYFVAAFLIGKKPCCGIRQSPRYVMMQGFAGMAVVYLAIGLAWDELIHYPILLIFIYGLTFFFANYGPNTTTFILPSLVYSAECRSTFNGLSAACGKLGALVGATIFSPLNELVHEKVVMLLCAMVALIALAMTAFFVRLRPEPCTHPGPGRGRYSVIPTDQLFPSNSATPPNESSLVV